MKKTITMYAPWALLLVAAIAGGCGGSDPKPTEQERVTRILTTEGGTWKPSGNTGITIDGVDVTEELFAGFSITFHEATFTTTGTTPVFLREDSWRFKDESARVIIRGQDNKEMTLTEISDAQLKLTLEWDATTHGGGRKGSLKGTHVFILNK